MSDENNTGGTPDPVKNVKMEMDRKFGNVEESLKTVQATNAQLLKELTALAERTKAAIPEKKEEEPSFYADPEAAVEKRVQAAKNEWRQEQDKKEKKVVEQQRTLSSLQAEFPELNDSTHPLTKRAVEIFNEYPDEYKASVLSYRAAVKEAALETDTKPLSRRRKEETEQAEADGWTMPSRRGDAPVKRKATQATLAFAEALGVDTSDAKVKESLDKYSSVRPEEWLSYAKR
jgi:hypothetical protein